MLKGLTFGSTIVCLIVTVQANSEEFSARKESVYVVQERLYDRQHEVGFLLGHVPDDDFHNAFPAGLNYIYHINNNYAWEVARAEWVSNREKDLKNDLIDDYGVEPSEFDKYEYFLHSSFVVKPTYGKDAVWNKSVINHESYFSIGAGFSGYEKKTSFGKSKTDTALSLGFGYGRKYFIGKSLNLILELRDIVVFKQSKTENNFYFGVGLGYRFDLAPRKQKQEREIDSVYSYLKDEHEEK